MTALIAPRDGNCGALGSNGLYGDCQTPDDECLDVVADADCDSDGESVDESDNDDDDDDTSGGDALAVASTFPSTARSPPFPMMVSTLYTDR
jgi:hypothetical protein